MPKKVKDSKIPGNLRFTNNANDQHMIDLWAFQQMTDKENNLSRDKIQFYATCMVEEKYKRDNEWCSNFEPSGFHRHYSSPEIFPGPRTDRDQLELFEVSND